MSKYVAPEAVLVRISASTAFSAYCVPARSNTAGFEGCTTMEGVAMGESGYYNIGECWALGDTPINPPSGITCSWAQN